MRDHIENVKIGSYLVVTEFIEEDESYDDGYPGVPRNRRRGKAQLNGAAMEVLAVDIPFVVVAMDEQKKDRFAIDIRECRFKIVNRRYVEAYRGGENSAKKKRKKEPREAAEPPGTYCTRCGARNKRMFSAGRGNFLECPNCGPPPNPVFGPIKPKAS